MAIVLPVALFIGIMIIFATNIQFRSNNFSSFTCRLIVSLLRSP